MTTFDDLEFGPREGLGGIQAQHTFPNGWGVSVIRGFGSYGGNAGLYELAVINKEGRLDYTTPVTDDVIGNLSEPDVTAKLTEVAALPAA